MEPVELTAAEAAALILRGELSSEELVRACLGRVADLEPDIGAWAHLAEAEALAQARAADAQRREGRGVGPLHGVPVGVKDIIDTADMPTEHGSAAFAGNRPEQDAACVTALRRAGAIILGKTVTTELATHVPAATRNPRNPAYTPGGSSAGSAAAVAAEMVPLAIGTQTAGSVIRPASYCGVYGFKPSFGLVPRSGILSQAPSLDTVGVFARSVEDLALLTDALQAYDSRDPACLVTSLPRVLPTAREEWPLAPLFAFVKTHAWAEADAATHEAFGELVEHLGGDVREIRLDDITAGGVAAAKVVQDFELAASYGPVLARAPGGVSASLAARIEEGRRVDRATYEGALAERALFLAAIEDVIREYGTILTPAALGPPPHGLASTGDPVFCAFWTYLGLPAVSVPLLEADGLPIGVQLVGAARDDGRLLRTARLLVEALI